MELISKKRKMADGGGS